MLYLSTKSKIFIANILSKILIFFLSAKKRVILRNNIKYEIDLNEAIDLGIFLGIKNEGKLYKIKNFLGSKKKLVLVDIGSNVGSVTLPLAKLFSLSTIISIEPTNFAFKKLKKNLKLNPDLEKRVKLFNIFISDKTRKVNFVHSSWDLKTKENKHKIHLGTLKKTSNKTKSLSQVLNKVGKKIDFIKIDVQGFELSVLKGAYNTLKTNRPVLCIEEDDPNNSLIIPFLENLNYDLVDVILKEHIFKKK